jgi:hypothetical protein
MKLFIIRWPCRLGALGDGLNAAQGALVRQAVVLRASATVAVRVLGAVNAILTLFRAELRRQASAPPAIVTLNVAKIPLYQL